jgi:hypothetical protein
MSSSHGVSEETLKSISTPDQVETRLGTLKFDDGAPSEETAALLYDNLDFMHGVEAFINSFPGASVSAMRRGFLDIGVEDNDVLGFPELMDPQSLFLTAQNDTTYFLSFLDLTNGPIVVELPALGPPTGILGGVNDMWFNWVTDMGLPGRDRGTGGRYLVVGPGYDGPLPDDGYFVSHCKTTRALWFGRTFKVDNDPAPSVEVVLNGVKIYPYQPGWIGSPVATYLAGAGPFGGPGNDPPPTRFVDVSGKSFNTIPPVDDSYWDLINELVQTEPVEAGNPEILGLLASVGIVKGKPFKPDERMRKILSDAVKVGNATARTLSFDPREEEGWAFYPGSAWFSMMWEGYEFLTPPPLITRNGVEQSPSDGARKHNARIAFFYSYTAVTPAMCMRLTGIGSQYIFATRDSRGDFLDGACSYRITLPPDIPESRFWSVVVYDRQTRSMLQTDKNPDLGSQSGTVETNADGSTDVFFGPAAPQGKESNWMQTIPGKGWFPVFRLYNPLQPYFDKTWRPSEIEVVS